MSRHSLGSLLTLTLAVLFVSQTACNSKRPDLVTVIKLDETVRCYYHDTAASSDLNAEQIERLNVIIRSSKPRPQDPKDGKLYTPDTTLTYSLVITDARGRDRQLSIGPSFVMAGDEWRVVRRKDLISPVELREMGDEIVEDTGSTLDESRDIERNSRDRNAE